MKVKVKEITGNPIFLRAKIVKLRDYILNSGEKEIVLDFEEIDFMSRAAADELKKVIQFLQSKGYQISIINLTFEPLEIFKIVSEK